MAPSGVPSICVLGAEENSEKSLKRKNSEMSGGTERDAKKSCSHFLEPRRGPCPIADVSIFADGKWLRTKALIGSGAMCFVMSSLFVSRFSVPKVKRDDQENLLDASHLI